MVFAERFNTGYDSPRVIFVANTARSLKEGYPWDWLNARNFFQRFPLLSTFKNIGEVASFHCETGLLDHVCVCVVLEVILLIIVRLAHDLDYSEFES